MAAVSLGAAGRGGEAAVKQLIGALHDTDADVRREAATALGGIGRGAHDAIPGLIHLANDPERGCTREAILALGMIVRDAAERGRPAPKPSPEVAGAIEKGLAWLARQQRPDGSWTWIESPFGGGGEVQRAAIDAQATALATLAFLDGGGLDRLAPQLRSALRRLASTDGSEGPLGRMPAGHEVSVTAALCAGARVIGEPECRAGAQRGFPTVPKSLAFGWRAVTLLEAGFAGLRAEGAWVEKVKPRSGGEAAILGIVGGNASATEQAFPGTLDAGAEGNVADPLSTFFGARARWYAGLRSDALVASILKAQRADGSWASAGYVGAAPATACMILSLEAAAGLSRPLTLPLPDAPQLRAAVATLRVAAESKDDAIRSAAEQALAGFAVR
jgi:hypothetical protein